MDSTLRSSSAKDHASARHERTTGGGVGLRSSVLALFAAAVASASASTSASAALIDAFTTPSFVVGTDWSSSGLLSVQGGLFDRRQVDLETYTRTPRQMAHAIEQGFSTFSVQNGSPWAYGLVHWTTSDPAGVDMSALTSLSFDYSTSAGAFYFDLTIVGNGSAAGGVLPRTIVGQGTMRFTPQELGMTAEQLRAVHRITLAFRQYGNAPNSISISNFNANGVETVPAPGALALGALCAVARKRRR